MNSTQAGTMIALLRKILAELRKATPRPRKARRAK